MNPLIINVVVSADPALLAALRSLARPDPIPTDFLARLEAQMAGILDQLRSLGPHLDRLEQADRDSEGRIRHDIATLQGQVDTLTAQRAAGGLSDAEQQQAADLINDYQARIDRLQQAAAARDPVPDEPAPGGAAGTGTAAGTDTVTGTAGPAAPTGTDTATGTATGMPPAPGTMTTGTGEPGGTAPMPGTAPGTAVTPGPGISVGGVGPAPGTAGPTGPEGPGSPPA